MRSVLLVVLGGFLLAACGGNAATPADAPPPSHEEPAGITPQPPALARSPSAELSPPPSPRDPRLAQVASWGYQLQGVDVDELAASPSDLLVVDAYDDEGEPWTPEDVARMGQDGRIVLSYLSIGEAEDYRDYWDLSWDADEDGEPDDGAPPWLAGENPDWEGNYLVRFWEPDWQVLIGEQLDRIVAAGFAGVYLDIVDAYERWQDDGRPAAAADMAAFVATLAERARVTDPDFLFFPQNAPGILGELGEDAAAAYLATVDGIGAEDTFFFGDADHDNRYDPQPETIRFLDRFVAEGKVVLAVDYLTDPELATRFRAEAHAHGFVPYVGVRDLDRLVEQPPG